MDLKGKSESGFPGFFKKKKEEMMERASAKKGKQIDMNLTDIVFSWRKEDVFNKELYKDRVCHFHLCFFALLYLIFYGDCENSF